PYRHTSFSASRYYLPKRRPRRSTLFPYTTLFRSQAHRRPPGDPLLVDRIDQRNRVRLARQNALKQRVKRRRRIGLVHLLPRAFPDRKSTRLNSSHVKISYAVFCLKKKK